MGVVVSVDNIRTGYDGRDILSGPTFDVGEGDVVAVIGPNGSGKTTLIRAILGTLPLKGGRVELFGGRQLDRAERERIIGYIPQRMELDRSFPISLREMLGLSTPQGDLGRYLDMLEIGHLLDRRVGELSGGQMQRALLAYSLVKEPKLLIMDEPTSWVDKRGADCILCIIEELSGRGIAMLVVSHDFSVIGSVATHVLGIGHGEWFFEPAGTPEAERRLTSLFGTLHHGERHGPLCIRCVDPDEQKGGGT